MPWKILLLDDDEEALKALGESLRAAMPGTQVQTLSSPHEAIASMQRERPDALVTDYRMAQMDGLMLAQAVRSMMPRLPIILITALPDAAAHDYLDKGTIKAVLRKPFDVKDLVTVLRTALTT